MQNWDVVKYLFAQYCAENSTRRAGARWEKGQFSVFLGLGAGAQAPSPAVHVRQVKGHNDDSRCANFNSHKFSFKNTLYDEAEIKHFL